MVGMIWMWYWWGGVGRLVLWLGYWEWRVVTCAGLMIAHPSQPSLLY